MKVVKRWLILLEEEQTNYSNMDIFFLLTIVIIIISLGILTLLNNPQKKENIFFFLVSLLAVCWVLSDYFSNVIDNVQISIFLNKMIFISTSLMMYMLYLFSTVYPTNRYKEHKCSNILMIILVLLSVFVSSSSYLVSSVEMHEDHSTINFGNGLYVYLIQFTLSLVLTGINFVISYRKAQGYERIRVQYLFLGILFSISGASITNLLLPVFAGDYDYSNLGPSFLIFFIAFTTTSMLKYRLFGVKFLLTIVLRFALLTAISVAFVYCVIWLLRVVGVDVYSFKAFSLVVLLCLFFSYFYYLLINKLKGTFLEKFAYGGVEPQKIANEYTRQISEELNIDKIATTITTLITTNFNVEKVGVFIASKSDNKIIYEKEIGYELNQFDKNEIKTLMEYEDIFSDGKVIIRSEIGGTFGKDQDKNGFSKTIYSLMKDNGVNVMIPLSRKINISGFVVIGEKMDKIDFTVEELKFLESLILNTSVAISRALIYKDVEKFNETLQDKVDEQTQDLKNKVLELEEARRKERDMVDIMGHELRTPATIVKLNADLLEKYETQVGEDRKSYEKYLFRIKNAINNEIDIINTLLSSAKLEGNRMVINNEEVELYSKVEECISSHKKDASNKGLKLFNKLPKDIPNVYADKSRVLEILHNLVSNAIKYTEKGSISIEGSYNNSNVTIKVIDTGIGISQRDLDRLGEKFYRVNNYTDDKGTDIVRPGGTGLGLYVTFNLVKNMGGSVKVTSELGKGSEFIFSLPRYTGQKSTVIGNNSDNMFEKLGLQR